MSKVGTIVTGEVPVYTTTGNHILPTDVGIGIEIELEGCRQWGSVAGWKKVADGSLRDGVEYVFKGPVGGQGAIDRITALGSYLETDVPKPTFRCSTHIHVDIRDLELSQVWKYVMAYTLFEDVLFDHCSEDRRYSNFCVPFFMADNMLVVYSRGKYNAPSDMVNLTTLSGWPKYSALNLQCIQSYGSVEFRGSHCITETQGLIALVQRMLHLRLLATESPEGEPMGSFMTRVHNLPLESVFPTGLKDNYKRDQRLSDICYCNGFYLVNPDEYVAPWEPVHRYIDTSDQAPQVDTINTEFFDVPLSELHPNGRLCVWNEVAFRRFGLEVPPEPPTCRTLMKLSAALFQTDDTFGIFELVNEDTRESMDQSFRWTELSSFFDIPTSAFSD